MKETFRKSGVKGGRPRKDGHRYPNGRLVPASRLAAFLEAHGLDAPPKPEKPDVVAPNLLVEQMVVAGDPHEMIARAVNCPIPEFEGRFADEIANGAARRRCEALDLLWRKAREGHPASIKEVITLTGASMGEAAFRRDAEAADDAEPRPKKRPPGKRELAHAAAQTAGEGTEWGDDLLGTMQ